MSDPDVMQSVITQLFDRLNAEDFEAVGTLFADEATLRSLGVAGLTGRSAILVWFQRMFGPFATHVEAPTRTLISGSTATVEMRFVGTVSGGGELTFDGVDILDFDQSGRILALSSWNDSLTVAKTMRTLLSTDRPSRP